MQLKEMRQNIRSDFQNSVDEDNDVITTRGKHHQFYLQYKIIISERFGGPLSTLEMNNTLINYYKTYNKTAK